MELPDIFFFFFSSSTTKRIYRCNKIPASYLLACFILYLFSETDRDRSEKIFMFDVLLDVAQTGPLGRAITGISTEATEMSQAQFCIYESASYFSY